VTPIELLPFTPDLLGAVAPWFDDAETFRWLGGRDWPENLLRLIADPPREHRGSSVRDRAGWIATLDREPVALIDTEVYEDGTAAVALVVAPAQRCRGVGAATLAAIARLLARDRGVDALVGGVERHNDASHRCVKAAGFVAVAEVPDEEGFINYVLRLDPAGARGASGSAPRSARTPEGRPSASRPDRPRQRCVCSSACTPRQR
jgi:RimJ/RimL family protein N-acetyltransferase